MSPSTANTIFMSTAGAGLLFDITFVFLKLTKRIKASWLWLLFGFMLSAIIGFMLNLLSPDFREKSKQS